MNCPDFLFPYGIRTEQSDIRAHVAVLAQRILVFKTAEMLRVIEEKRFPSSLAFQSGINQPTAQGYLVPIKAVPDIRVLNFQSYNWNSFPPQTALTSSRGKAAVEVVCELLKHGRFPLWIEAEEAEDKTIQIKGTDIIITANKRIQVKCDYCAGEKTWASGCTGNLFIQTAEINPLKRI
jgi:hypothetical protein